MRIALTLGLVLLATSLVGCCPGSMLGDRAQITEERPMDSDGDGVSDAMDRCPDTPQGVRVNRDGCSDEQLAAMAPPPPREPSRSERELREHGEIRLENVYFESNSARLTSQSSAALDEAGAALEKYPALRLEVEGHSDVIGDARYNQRLSQARAEAVRDYLLAHFSLKKNHFSARGYGESRPESEGRTAEDLQRDRRVVLRVLNPDALPKNVDIAH